MKKKKNNHSIYPGKKLKKLDSKNKKRRYYTIEEKREMALKGEHVPVCVYD